MSASTPAVRAPPQHPRGLVSIRWVPARRRRLAGLHLVWLLVLGAALGAQEAAAQVWIPPGSDTGSDRGQPDICVSEPAPTLGEGHPFHATLARAWGDRGGMMGEVVVEEVHLGDDLTLRIEGRGCTYYVVDYLLQLPEPGVLARAGGGEWEREREAAARLARALRVLAPHDRSAIRVERIAAILEAAVEGGSPRQVMDRRVDVGDNELGEFFVLTRECEPGLGPGGACALRLRAVIGL